MFACIDVKVHNFNAVATGCVRRPIQNTCIIKRCIMKCYSQLVKPGLTQHADAHYRRRRSQNEKEKQISRFWLPHCPIVRFAPHPLAFSPK